MTNSTSLKHLVCMERPGGAGRLSIAYSTLKEADAQAIALARNGYTILEIVPMELPKPNAA